MRNKLTWIIALITLTATLPLTAFAGRGDSRPRRGSSETPNAIPADRGSPPPSYGGSHRGYDSQPRGGFLVVTNPNRAPVEVLMDRETIAFVGPGETARLGPFELGEHRLRARFIDAASGIRLPIHRGAVALSPRHPARLQLPVADSSILALDNTWVEPVDVRINGASVGRLQARSTGRFAAPMGSQVELVTPRGEIALSRRVRSGALTTEAFALVAPSLAPVTVTNPLGGRLRLVDTRTGQVIAQLQPFATTTVSLPSGRSMLEVRHAGRAIDATGLVASPWGHAAWRIQPPTHTRLTLVNSNPLPVQVFLGGQLLGSVAADSAGVFDGVPTGYGQLVVRAQRRYRTLESTVTVNLDPLSGGTVQPLLALYDGGGAWRQASYQPPTYPSSRPSYGGYGRRSRRGSRR